MPPAEAKPGLEGLSVGLLGRHELYVHSLAALLVAQGAEAHVVEDSDTALGRMQIDRVHVLLVESPLSSELERVASLGPPVIALAERAGPEQQVEATALGARALLAKNATLAELSLAIRSAVRERAPAPPQGLTRRQRQVLELIAEGLDNTQIAARLEISERTARAHVSAVLERLGAHNRTQAAVMALRRGWVGFLTFLIALASALAATPLAQAADGTVHLSTKVATRLAPLAGASSAWIADADNGEQLYALNPDRRRTPASLQKLFTSATALDRLGPDSRYHTAVTADAAFTPDGLLDGNLYVEGFGDPSFGTSGLGQLAAGVRSAGVRQVTGRAYGDESYFDSRRGLPAGGFRLSIDVGPLSALSFNAGTLAGLGHGFQFDPPLFVAQRFRHALTARSVSVRRAARVGKTPSGAHELASVNSPRLSALIRHMNQISDNYYAETLLKGLGARFGSAGTTANGAFVVRQFEREIGIATRVLDGSGLSRGDAASARAVGELLMRVRDKPWFDPFYRSLPLAGRSGTLRKRMRGTAAQGRCRAKTGTLIGVSALAGYCRSRAGRRIVFALLMNGVSVQAARLAQDRIVATLAG